MNIYIVYAGIGAMGLRPSFYTAIFELTDLEVANDEKGAA